MIKGKWVQSLITATRAYRRPGATGTFPMSRKVEKRPRHGDVCLCCSERSGSMPGVINLGTTPRLRDKVRLFPWPVVVQGMEALSTPYTANTQRLRSQASAERRAGARALSRCEATRTSIGHFFADFDAIKRRHRAMTDWLPALSVAPFLNARLAPMRSLLLALSTVLALFLTEPCSEPGPPAPVDGDFVLRDFRFFYGRVAAELSCTA